MSDPSRPAVATSPDSGNPGGEAEIPSRAFDVGINGDLTLPRGLRHQAADLIARAGSVLVHDDLRNQGTELDVSFLGDLDDRQAAAVDMLLAHEDGILHAPTG